MLGAAAQRVGVLVRAMVESAHGIGAHALAALDDEANDCGVPAMCCAAQPWMSSASKGKTPVSIS